MEWVGLYEVGGSYMWNGWGLVLSGWGLVLVQDQPCRTLPHSLRSDHLAAQSISLSPSPSPTGFRWKDVCFSSLNLNLKLQLTLMCVVPFVMCVVL